MTSYQQIGPLIYNLNTKESSCAIIVNMSTPNHAQPFASRAPFSQYAGGAVVVTLIILLVMLLLTCRLHFCSQDGVNIWNHINFRADFIGSGVRELIPPLALLALLSNTSLFQRIVTAQGDARDQSRLVALLIFIQVFISFYNIGILIMTNELVTTGTFVTIVAGLLGGWGSGLVVGTVVVVLESSLGLYYYYYYDSFNLVILRTSTVLAFTLLIWVCTTLLAGTLVGVLADWLGQRRFNLWVAVGLDQFLVFVTFGSGVLIGGTVTTYYSERLLPSLLASGIAMTILVLLVRRVQAEEVRRQAEAAELALTQTKLALAEAELRALRAQINPHFFFNSLNTIRYFIRTEPQTARELLANLSEIFRRALYAGEFVTLADEILNIKAYLALEKARLDERLQIVWNVEQEIDSDMMIPTLILQPIVENAIIHGIAPQPEGGTLHITIKHSASDLLLQVHDDGGGFEPQALITSLDTPLGPQSTKERPSIGMKNIHQRLRRLYGEEYGVQINSKIGQGTRIVIKIPL